MKLDRRTVLRGMLGGLAATVALPPFEALMDDSGTAWADGTSFPSRFALWTWANGIVPQAWVPATQGSGASWALSPLLAPLAAVKPKLVVVTGTDVRTINHIPHYSGFGGLLTGFDQIGVEFDHTFGGPTIDQQIAAVIGGDTPYRSIEAGAWFDDPVSHNGPHSPNPPEINPFALYERLFGATFRAPGEDVAIDPKLGLRQSVLDVVTDRVTALQSKLGRADRDRLDQHLSGIRDLELRLTRLQAGPPAFDACKRADEPTSREHLEDPFLNHQALTDLLVMALACDQTRVITMSFMTPTSNYLFPGATAGHHELTHNEPGDQPTVQSDTVRTMEELAYFLEALDAVQEGDATLLDHALVLGTSDVSLGKGHTITEYPLLLAGSASGALVQDTHYRSASGESASKAMLTVLRAMGVQATSYGDGSLHESESLTAIEA